eukprot:COSAG01_NODE_30156_length_621_cov_1.990421_1_plen_112_part_10
MTSGGEMVVLPKGTLRMSEPLAVLSQGMSQNSSQPVTGPVAWVIIIMTLYCPYPPLGPLRLRLAAGSEHRLPSPPSPRTVGGGSSGGRRGKGSRGPMPGLCTGPLRYRVWGT